MQAQIRIDRAALRANVLALRQLTAPAQFMAVVKANAYGHGLALVAPAIADIVDAYGVYEVSEATALRALGLTQPIHLLGAIPPQEFAAALAAEAILPCWSPGAWLRDLIQASQEHGRPAQVQLKIDSGLTRLGMAPQHAAELLATLRAQPQLVVTGAYSHLAAAEELDSRYTLEQLERFTSTVPSGSVAQRHIAASAAAMLWPQTRLDMVRCGIALYGLWPSAGSRIRMESQCRLAPVLHWSSQLVCIREVASKTTIGYGCTYRPSTDIRIGILPIGYAEGLPRALSNKGAVLIDGIVCPVIGRICMNMAIIDVSAIANPHVGQRVTLIGSDGDASISADTLAEHCDTISYEIVARLPANIPRSYCEDTLTE